jgi:hypothetical protein
MSNFLIGILWAVGAWVLRHLLDKLTPYVTKTENKVDDFFLNLAKYVVSLFNFKKYKNGSIK